MKIFKFYFVFFFLLQRKVFVREFLITRAKGGSSDSINNRTNFKNPFLRQQTVNTNRSSSVNSTSGDTNFSTKTEAITISHTGGGILEDTSRINSVEEGLALFFVVGENSISVVRTKLVDVLNSSVDVLDKFDSHAVVTIFSLEVSGLFGDLTREDGHGDRATEELDTGFSELLENATSVSGVDASVDEESFSGIAG